MGSYSVYQVTKPPSHFKINSLFFLWIFYFILKPVYVFPSGNPQPCDFILLLTFLYSLRWQAAGFSNIWRKNGLWFLFAFVSYVIIFQFMQFLKYSDFQLLKPSMFYIFNILAVISFIRFAAISRNDAFRASAFGLVISLCIQLLIAVFTAQAFYRFQGSFNNPNQLAYFALLSLPMIALAFEHVSQKKKKVLIFGCCVAYLLVILSLSRAAFAGSLVMLPVLLGRGFKKAVVALIALSIGAFVVFQVAENSLHLDDYLNRWQQRWQSVGDLSQQTLETRGYGRILDHPEAMVFGNGENTQVYILSMGKELHSTYGTLLYCYGIVGSVFFLCFIATLFVSPNFSNLVYLFPPAIYGLSHQGLRFSIVWLLFAMVASKEGCMKNVQTLFDGQHQRMPKFSHNENY